jgi:hypothetical protein
MKEEIKQTGMLVSGVVTDVTYVDQIGKHVISLMISGMDQMLKVTLEKGKLPDPKKFEIGVVAKMKVVVNHWNGNTYFNEAPA